MMFVMRLCLCVCRSALVLDHNRSARSSHRVGSGRSRPLRLLRRCVEVGDHLRTSILAFGSTISCGVSLLRSRAECKFGLVVLCWELRKYHLNNALQTMKREPLTSHCHFRYKRNHLVMLLAL